MRKFHGPSLAFKEESYYDISDILADEPYHQIDVWIFEFWIDPCKEMPCGRRAICKLDEFTGAPNCTCETGYSGNPKVECFKGITFMTLADFIVLLLFVV